MGFNLEKLKAIAKPRSEEAMRKARERMENVENQIPGYKYVLELSISIDDPLDGCSGDRICICDTRDECVEQIKKEIERYVRANEKDRFDVKHEPYRLTRLGTYIKWFDNKEPQKTWWWTFGIFPVRYLTKDNQPSNDEAKNVMDTAFKNAMDEFNKNLQEEQKDIDPEIGKLIEDNFYDLL